MHCFVRNYEAMHKKPDTHKPFLLLEKNESSYVYQKKVRKLNDRKKRSALRLSCLTVFYLCIAQSEKPRKGYWLTAYQNWEVAKR